MVEEINQRILVIDDTPAIHDDFRKVLGAESAPALQEDEALLFGEGSAQRKETRFAIDYAHQGEEGLALVREALEADRPYAMAFIDMRMPPGWDGIETIEHIWQEYPELQAVICTAYSDYSWDEVIRRLGKTDRLLILKKPFDPMEVRQLACALTEKWGLTRWKRLRLECHPGGWFVWPSADDPSPAAKRWPRSRPQAQKMVAICPFCAVRRGWRTTPWPANSNRKTVIL